MGAMNNPIEAPRLRHLLKRIAEQAQTMATDLDNGGVPDGMALMRFAAEIVQSSAETRSRQVFDAERMLERGVHEYGRTRYEIRDGNTRRTAEVYPNAHNDGATYGLSVSTWENGREHRSGGEFRGAGWTREAAEGAAKAWIRDGVMPGVCRETES